MKYLGDSHDTMLACEFKVDKAAANYASIDFCHSVNEENSFIDNHQETRIVIDIIHVHDPVVLN